MFNRLFTIFCVSHFYRAMAEFGALNKVTQPKFYCKKSCGDPDFSIDEWNQAFEYCEKAGIEGVERDKILSPELFPCTEQCESCINTVLDTQLANKKKREQRALANCG